MECEMDRREGFEYIMDMRGNDGTYSVVVKPGPLEKLFTLLEKPSLLWDCKEHIFSFPALSG
jgi:hypothetical protein